MIWWFEVEDQTAQKTPTPSFCKHSSAVMRTWCFYLNYHHLLLSDMLQTVDGPVLGFFFSVLFVITRAVRSDLWVCISSLHNFFKESSELWEVTEKSCTPCWEQWLASKRMFAFLLGAVAPVLLFPSTPPSFILSEMHTRSQLSVKQTLHSGWVKSAAVRSTERRTQINTPD